MKQVIGNKLLDIRLQLKYKHQKEFAEFLELDYRDYSKVENNKKQVGLLVALKISEKLKMNVNDIFYIKDDEE
jgi:putative transcriptional regulator